MPLDVERTIAAGLVVRLGRLNHAALGGGLDKNSRQRRQYWSKYVTLRSSALKTHSTSGQIDRCGICGRDSISLSARQQPR
jgi:hypothetical protein